MSTKTSIKRIALVAVAGLGFGMVSTVSANAAAGDFTTSATSATLYTPISTAVTTTVLLAATDTTSTMGAGSVTATLTSGVTDATTTTTLTATGVEGPFADGGTTNNTHPVTYSTNVATIAQDPDNTAVNLTTTAKIFGTLSFTANTAGKYVITLTSGGVFSAGSETNGTVTIYVGDLWGEVGDGLSNGNQSNLTLNGVVGTFNAVTLSAQTVVGSRLITVSGAGATINAFTTGTNATAAISSDKLSMVISDASTAEATTFTVNTPQAGTITIKAFSGTNGIYSTTPYGTVTVTVNSAAVSGSIDAASSTAVLNAGATWSSTTGATVYAANTASTTPVAAIKVSLAQVSGAITSTTAVTASLSGAGSLVLNDNNDHSTSVIGLGRSLSSTVAATTETFYVLVTPDGTSGVGTITITAGTFTATKSVTFYGAVAKLTATVKKSVVANSGSATSGAIAVVATDAAGVVVPAQSLTITSSDSTVATGSGSSSTATEAADGAATVAVTGASAKSGKVTLTIKVANGVSTTADVTIAAVKAATVTLTFDKDEYAPGELATLTLTAKDANGLPVADGTATSFLTGALASSASVTSALQYHSTTATSVNFVAGSSSVKFYMPLVAGTFKVSGTVGIAGTYVDAAIDSAALTASVNVVAADGGTSAAIDAANEATDAANAATDAANAAAEAADAATAAAQDAQAAAMDAQAAVAALATSVSALIAGIKAQITTLTNLVIKIQKKVKA